MQVTFVDQSEKRARTRVARILDAYLPRVGPSAWTGFLGEEGLRVVAEKLRRSASRQTSTSCFVAGRNHGRPVFIVGSRRPYNAAGMYPVSTRAPAAAGQDTDSPGYRQLRGLVALAGLLHDIGKACRAFQAKVRAHGPLADPVRHEIISALFVDELCRASADDGALVAWLAGDATPEDLEAAYDRAAGRCAAVLQDQDLGFLSWDGARPFASALRLLVATHHRLIDAEMLKDRVGFQAGHHVNQKAAEDWSGAGAEHAKAASVFRDQTYLDALRREAGEMQAALAAPWCLQPLAVYAYGRLCLVLGDQHGSALRAPAKQTPELLANTVKLEDGSSAPAQSVAEHLLCVTRQAKAFVRTLRRTQDSFPAVRPDDLPETLVRPAGSGRFAWQRDAVDKIAAAGTDGGLFGVVLVRTGGGKTRGSPAALLAASPRCRFFLGLGLRSLTLQSGLEYVREVGFRAQDVATLVGDAAARRLHDAQTRETAATDGVGTQTDTLEDVVVSPHQAAATGDPEGNAISDAELAALGGDAPDLQRQLPHQVELALQATGQTSLAKLLSTPVVAATIDQIMASADARSTRHAARMLRLATSDLILDEIDLYEPEDLAAILRLVCLAGAFGRRVIVASATVPPTVVETLAQAYCEGYAAYASLSDTPDRSAIAWIADDPTLTRVEPLGGVPLRPRHDRLVAQVIQGLDHDPPKRRVELVVPEARDESAAFAAMRERARAMHARFAFEHDGLRVSAGVVRFANVRACRAFAKTIARDGIADTVVALACYHARLTGLARFELETRLNRMLVRKGDDPNAALLGEPDVQRALDHARRTGRRDVMVLVVATPVEETGRDHDFDYAVAEPSSVRALIQLAGRVRRHRAALPEAPPNIAVLSAPLRYWRGEPAPYWQYPGIETPPQAPRIPDVQLAAAEVPELLDTELLARRLDARLCLAPPAHGLAGAEHEMIARFLADPIHGGLRFAEDPDAPFSRWLPTHRRFRRAEPGVLFFQDWRDGEAGWRAMDTDGSGTSVPVDDRFVDAALDWAPDVLPIGGDSPRCSLARLRPLFRGYDDRALARALLSFSMRAAPRVEYSWFFGGDRAR